MSVGISHYILVHTLAFLPVPIVVVDVVGAEQLSVIQNGGELILRVACSKVVDLAQEEGSLLGEVVEHECAWRGHVVPVVASPSLNHEQEVESPVVFLVVCLEEISRVLHEPPNLAGEQHLGEYVAIVEEVFAVRCIPYGNAQ